MLSLVIMKNNESSPYFDHKSMSMIKI